MNIDYGRRLAWLFVGLFFFAVFQAADVGGVDLVQAASEEIQQIEVSDITNLFNSIVYSIKTLLP